MGLRPLGCWDCGFESHRGWMSVSCKNCMLSGRGLCIGLITCPEESYRVWCVSECDGEASILRRPWPTGGCCAMGTKVQESLYQLWHVVSVSVIMQRNTRYSRRTISRMIQILKEIRRFRALFMFTILQYYHFSDTNVGVLRAVVRVAVKKRHVFYVI
jgi:hypothetical protein